MIRAVRRELAAPALGLSTPRGHQAHGRRYQVSIRLSTIIVQHRRSPMNTEPNTTNTGPCATRPVRELIIIGLVWFLLASAAGGFHSLPHNLIHYGMPVGATVLILYLVWHRRPRNDG